MKNFLALLGAMATGVVCPQAKAATTTITFSELPRQPANGVSLNGVTFSFQILGSNSTDATFNSSGPGVLTYTSDPSLEGNTSGVLGLDFAVPVSHLSFGVALASMSVLTPGVTVSLFDSSFTRIDKSLLITTPLISFSEGRFTEDGLPVSHASIYFNNSVPRFVVDNLTFTPVPEPSVTVLMLAGLSFFGVHPKVRAALAIKRRR